MKYALIISATLLASFAAATPSAAAGKAIFSTNCSGCHGMTAGGGVGPNLKEPASWKYDIFKRALLQGKDDKGVALRPPMPKWGNGFAPNMGKAPTDDQMKSLQMYIKSIAK